MKNPLFLHVVIGQLSNKHILYWMLLYCARYQLRQWIYVFNINSDDPQRDKPMKKKIILTNNISSTQTQTQIRTISGIIWNSILFKGGQNKSNLHPINNNNNKNTNWNNQQNQHTFLSTVCMCVCVHVRVRACTMSMYKSTNVYRKHLSWINTWKRNKYSAFFSIACCSSQWLVLLPSNAIRQRSNDKHFSIQQYP